MYVGKKPEPGEEVTGTFLKSNSSRAFYREQFEIVVPLLFSDTLIIYWYDADENSF
jgi:hypothetical protein